MTMVMRQALATPAATPAPPLTGRAATPPWNFARTLMTIGKKARRASQGRHWAVAWMSCVVPHQRARARLRAREILAAAVAGPEDQVVVAAEAHCVRGIVLVPPAAEATNANATPSRDDVDHVLMRWCISIG